MILSNIAATDPIIGPSRGSAQGWIEWVEAHRNSVKRPDDVIAYIEAVYALCAPDDMPDAFIVIADAFHETGNFTNRWWNERLNAGSLGVTGDPAQNEASPTFKTVTQAARAHVAHLLLYATGQINRGGLKPADDPRYLAYREAYGETSYPTLQGLTGRYATDPFYAAKIAQRQQEIYPVFSIPVEGGNDVSETIVFGRVPKPTIENRICTKEGNGHGYWEVSPRQIVGGCRHVTDGGGTIEWYQEFFSIGGERADDALVDFIIDRSGRIAMLNDPFGTRSPWANGGTDGLEGDGVAFYNTLGVAAVNGRLFSCEHVGGGTDAMTAAQLKSSIALWAWIFDGASNHPRAPRVPYNSYPINPAVGINTDLEHFEFATKPCPGSGMRAQTSQHQDGVRALLKQYQVVTSTDPVPVPEEPVPANIYPPGMTVELARRLYGKLKVDWAALPFAFDPERSECRHWLDAGKAQLKPGDRYDKAKWPKIEDCIRRGNGNRVFTWSDGSSFEQPARSN